jgi:hypothetical protein
MQEEDTTLQGTGTNEAEDKILKKQSLKIQREVMLADKNFEQLTKIDNKISNNMLKLNFSFYILAIGIMLLYILLIQEIFYARSKSDLRINRRVSFSLLYFTLKDKNETYTEQKNSYFCIKDLSDCESSSNTCTAIDFIDLNEEFGLSCNKMKNIVISSRVVSYLKILKNFLFR